MAGAESLWFLGRARNGAYKTIANRAAVNLPGVKGAIQGYLEQQSGDEVTKKFLENNVKVCGICGKPCGVTLLLCNHCNSDLTQIDVTHTLNVFSAFILGAEKNGNSPLKISIRLETDSLLVFDDPLALSPAHFCAIPTTEFIPDWRYLLKNPSRGLQLVQALMQSCHNVLAEQFLTEKEWKVSVLQDPNLEPSHHSLAGFNFPPSQNQLHVQYIVPPLIPQQYFMFLRGNHFTYGRFFPVKYVERCLEALTRDGTIDKSHDSLLSLSIGDLISFLDKRCDVSYKEDHALFISEVEAAQMRFGNWTKNNFEGVYHIQVHRGGGKDLLFKSFSGEETMVEEHTAIAQDKKILQNYGRPYDEMGNPSGGFYSFPKHVESLVHWQ